MQGGAKFAGYEACVSILGTPPASDRRESGIWILIVLGSLTTVQKKWLVDLSGSHENAVKNRTAIYLGGAAIAE